MRKSFLGLVLGGLFALSVGTAGTVFTALILAQPAFGAVCPDCELIDVSCPGSPCTCQWDDATGKYFTKCQLLP